MKLTDMLALLAKEKRPVRFVASRFLARTGIAQLLDLKIKRQGYDLHFFNTALSKSLWMATDDRTDDVEIVGALLKAGGTYVDIGANIGDLALAGALAVGSSGKVFAFEAHPRIFGLMAQNVRLNGLTNIHPVNAACAADFGWARFSDERSDDINKIGAGEIVVPTLPADRLLPPEQIDLIKIDVEGFELFVLQGLQDALERTRNVLIEVGDAHFEQFGYRYADIHDHLMAKGFAIFAQEKAGTTSSWVRVDHREHPFPTVQNILAMRDGEPSHFLGS